MDAIVLILAAGRGTRMRSQLPKVLHPLCGQPLIYWPIDAAMQAEAARVAVVCSPDDQVQKQLPESVSVVIQQQALGTGDAVKSAAELIKNSKNVFVLSGDHPLITSSEIETVFEAHNNSNAAATVVSAELDDPSGYGRIVRRDGGGFDRIVETKMSGDATDEQLQIKEINTGTYCFRSNDLLEVLDKLSADNAQGEHYLGDVLSLLTNSGKKVTIHKFKKSEIAMGINSRKHLAEVHTVAQARILEKHMLAGVTVVDPLSTVIDVGVQIEAETTIEPFTVIKSGSEIGSGATVGPLTTVIDSKIGSYCRVIHSYLDSCELEQSCTVGPFAYLRPDTVMHDGSKAGAFVEIKNSDIGAATKVPHLSYIGDATIGEQSNIGAGNITANYDGKQKHRTVIGKHVKTGVDTSFVAPLNVGDNAYTGAGSVLTEDVPDGALGIARQRQTNIDGYTERPETLNEKTRENENDNETTSVE